MRQAGRSVKTTGYKALKKKRRIEFKYLFARPYCKISTVIVVTWVSSKISTTRNFAKNGTKRKAWMTTLCDAFHRLGDGHVT